LSPTYNPQNFARNSPKARKKTKSGEKTMNDKQAYQNNMETRFREVGAKIDQLQARSEQATADVKADLNERIQNLEAKRQLMLERLQELKSSGEEAWENLKTGVQAAWDDLSSAVEEAASKFSGERQKG
jgi:predicted  nucleic acid-binding Zn-ribbon protein